MAVQIVPQDTLATGLGTATAQGLGSLLEGLAAGKIKGLQAQQFQSADLPAILAYLDPQVQASYLKQLGAAQQLSGRIPRVGERVENLLDLNKSRSIDRTLRFFGGADKDTYDLYAKELQQDIKKIYPDAIVPTSKMDAQARLEGLTRLKKRLDKDFGPQQAEQIMEAPASQMELPTLQEAEQQQQAPEGRLDQALRTLAGAVAEAVGPLAALASPATGAAIVGSDILGALESYRQPILREEEVEEIASKMDPESAQRLRENYAKEKEAPFKLSDYLPTTKNIKNIVGRVLPDNYLEPQSKGEALIQDAVSKGVGLVSFGGMSIPRAIAGTAAGIGAREFAKEYGAGPLAQNATELIFTMMPNVLYNNIRSNLKESASKMYDKFDDSAAARQRIPIKEVIEESKKARNKAEKFKASPSNKQIAKTLKEFEQEAIGDNIKLSDAVNAKREIGRIISETPLDKTARGTLTAFNDKLKDAIHNEGAKLDAHGYSYLKKADDIWSGIKGGESIVDAIKNVYKGGKYRSLGLYTLAGRFPGTAAGALAGRFIPGVGFAGGALAGGIGQELVQTYKFFKNTPGAWQELAKVGQDSLKGNAKAAAARLKKLDDKAFKYEQEENKKRQKRVTRGL